VFSNIPAALSGVKGGKELAWDSRGG